MSPLTVDQEPEAVELIDPNQAARAAAVSTGAALWAMLVGASSLVGWLFNIEALKAPLSPIAIKANASLALLTSGLALFLLREWQGRARGNTAGQLLAAITLAIGALTLCEHILRIDLGIDQALFREPPGVLATYSPNRMGVPASFCFTLLGLALLLLDGRTRTAQVFSQFFATLVALVSLLPIVGYVCQVQELYGLAKVTAIALHTAVSLCVLGLGVLCARPDYELVRVFCRRDSAGVLARRLLGPAIFLPLLLGAVTALGILRGWFGSAFAVSLLVIALITSLTALIWRTCRAVGSLEVERAQAQAEIVNTAKFPGENPNPVFRASREGELLYGNPAARTLLQCWGRQPGERLPEHLRKRFAEAVAAGVSLEIEEVCLDRVYALQCVPIPGKPYFNIYGQDVTERRAAERELARVNAELEERVRQRTKELQETNDQLNAFCYSVAHDLKAPLRSQAAFATLLQKDFGDRLGDTGCGYARKIYDAAERQSRLVSDLLAHMSLTRAELPVEPVALDAVLAQVKADLSLEIHDRKAVLDTGPLNHEVIANSASLHLVLLNLVSNAIKFVDSSRQPKVRVWAESVRAAVNGNSAPKSVRLWVEDNGIGIPPEYHHKLFGVFQRLHNARNYPGTGMGLAIVKKAAERMGGTVGVQSLPGEGTRFWVELPAP